MVSREHQSTKNTDNNGLQNRMKHNNNHIKIELKLDPYRTKSRKHFYTYYKMKRKKDRNPKP